MKLLIATGLYPPEIGGPATYTAMLEAELPQHGFELVVVPFGAVRRYPKIIRHALYTYKLIRAGRACDAIYALDPVSVGIPAHIASRILRKHFLLRVAGDYAWEQGQQRFGVTDTLDTFTELPKRHYSLPVRLLAGIQTYVSKRATRVIVPSEYLRRIVTLWGVPSERVTRIYSALYPLVVQDSRAALRRIFEYEGYVMVTAGRLVPWKGIETLVRILPAVRESLGSGTLVVIGDGPLRSRLKAVATEMGVAPCVRFVGRMPKDTLGAAILGADLFVLNTAYEGLSHQLLEVMDLGVPIVSTHVGGNPELITHGETGLLVPFDAPDELTEAIVQIARDATLRTRLVENSKQQVRAFEKETVVTELAALLQSI